MAIQVGRTTRRFSARDHALCVFDRVVEQLLEKVARVSVVLGREEQVQAVQFDPMNCVVEERVPLNVPEEI